MFNIPAIQDPVLQLRLQRKLFDNVRSRHAPGQLESIALRLGLIQHDESPRLCKPHLLVFAADHGVVAECVSSFPQSATRQRVRGLLDGHSSTSVICRQHQLELRVVDAGINADLPEHPLLLSRKVSYGSRNLALEAAMSEDQLDACLVRGSGLVNALAERECNMLLLGEASVGSTTAAAALMQVLTGIPLDQCVGAGSGVGQLTQARKHAAIAIAIRRLTHHPRIREVLCALGGFDIIMMAGAILRAAERRMIIVIDGFVTAVAALIASSFHRHALDYCIFSDVSDERGHASLLAWMKASPLLPLSLHRGEGLAATMVFPIIAAACSLLQVPAATDREDLPVEEMHGQPCHESAHSEYQQLMTESST
jgi:nicotinate-nucleotide--dimethylbenzimidazole phosphoribosyltransferase